VARPVALLAPRSKALKALANAGLTATSVFANLHHRRIVPLMERRPRIFEMEETADPVALALSQLLPDLLPREYTATRARRAINLKAMRTDDVALWSFSMLPEGPLVSRVPAPLRSIDSWSIVAIPEFHSPPAGDGRERRVVRPSHTLSPSVRGTAAGARAGGAQEG
jgi:hypothetical protein